MGCLARMDNSTTSQGAAVAATALCTNAAFALIWSRNLGRRGGGRILKSMTTDLRVTGSASQHCRCNTLEKITQTLCAQNIAKVLKWKPQLTVQSDNRSRPASPWHCTPLASLHFELAVRLPESQTACFAPGSVLPVAPSYEKQQAPLQHQPPWSFAPNTYVICVLLCRPWSKLLATID